MYHSCLAIGFIPFVINFEQFNVQLLKVMLRDFGELRELVGQDSFFLPPHL
jgi:hypothetical protein